MSPRLAHPPMTQLYSTRQVVLNSDSESVLLKGLHRFASQIRREHGLLLTPLPTSSPETGVEGHPKNGKYQQHAGSLRHPTGSRNDYGEGNDDDNGGDDNLQAGENGGGVDGARMDVEEEAETDKEEETDGVELGERGRDNTGCADARGRQQKENLLEINTMVQGDGDADGRGSDGRDSPEDGREGGDRKALVAAAERGEAPGLLGEYLRGSPQLNDLLSLWDLDMRKVGLFSIYADRRIISPLRGMPTCKRWLDIWCVDRLVSWSLGLFVSCLICRCLVLWQLIKGPRESTCALLAERNQTGQ